MTLLSYTSAAPNPMYIGLDDDTNALTQIFGLSPQYFSTLEKKYILSNSIYCLSNDCIPHHFNISNGIAKYVY